VDRTSSLLFTFPRTSEPPQDCAMQRFQESAWIPPATVLRTLAAAHREYPSPCPRNVPYYKLVLPPLQRIDARIARLRKPSAPKDGIGVAYATANTIGPVADPSAHLPSSRRSRLLTSLAFKQRKMHNLGQVQSATTHADQSAPTSLKALQNRRTAVLMPST
jgi:hypothetical protein